MGFDKRLSALHACCVWYEEPILCAAVKFSECEVMSLAFISGVGYQTH